MTQQPKVSPTTAKWPGGRVHCAPGLSASQQRDYSPSRSSYPGVAEIALRTCRRFRARSLTLDYESIIITEIIRYARLRDKLRRPAAASRAAAHCAGVPR